jgi:hypothetical protein
MGKKQSQPTNQSDFNKLWDSVEREREKHKKELEVDRKRFIENIKKVNKDDILPKQKEPEKLTLWMKIKKVLMG